MPKEAQPWESLTEAVRGRASKRSGETPHPQTHTHTHTHTHAFSPNCPRERGAGRERLHCLLHICSNHQPKTRSSKRKEPESFPHHFAGLLCPWDSPGKNTGVIAISFSRGSARPRDPIWFCYIAGRFFFFYHLSHQGSPHCVPRPRQLSHKRSTINTHKSNQATGQLNPGCSWCCGKPTSLETEGGLGLGIEQFCGLRPVS